MKYSKTGNGYVEFPKIPSNFQKFHRIAEIFGENVEMFGENVEMFGENSKTSGETTKKDGGAHEFLKISKYFVKI